MTISYRSAFLANLAVCFFISTNAYATSIEAQQRDQIVEKRLSCFSQAAQTGVQWDDICVTSDKQHDKFGDDLEQNSSLDDMIKRHEKLADEMLNESVLPDEDQPIKSVDDVVQENEQDPEAKRTVDDFVAEQKILENSDQAQKADDSIQLAQARNDAPEQEIHQDFSDTNSSLKYMSVNSFKRDEHQNSDSVEFGFEYNRFRYEEDVFDLVDRGNLFGIYGGYTMRPAKKDNVFNDIIDVYKFEGRFNYGKVDYKSAPSGTIDNITDWTFEVRLLAGKDFLMGEQMRWTPFLGLGYRYLNDDSGGMRSSTGALGYEREANYIYLPIGLEFAAHITDSWIISPSLEYDVFIQGRQESHLSDVSKAFPDLTNKQHDGYGVRGSIKFIKEFQSMSLVLEPYFRFWDVEDSATTTASGTGFIVTGLEPANSSTEYGLRLGAMF